MSQQSKLRQSRNQWKRKAKERAEHNRYLRKELERIRQERDRSQQAIKETQDRLRQQEAQAQGLVVPHKVDLVWLALQLFVGARISFRAVSRVLRLLAEGFGIKKAPCPQTLVNWVTNLSMVRIQSARLLQGVSVSLAPFTNGFIWTIDISIGLGTGKMLSVLALNAHHHQLLAAAPGLQQGHCLAVSGAASWTGETIADLLQRVMLVMGRPAASLKDGGSERHKAIGLLEEQGLASPSIDDLSHAVANMLKRRYHGHPQCTTFVSACGRVSGKLKHTMLACLAPPTVHTKARFMHVHRLVTWAERLRKLSPAGGAKAGSTLAKLRACLDAFPTCKALSKQFRDDAVALLACQKRLKTQGLSHSTLAQCEPLIDAIPSVSVRRALTGSLHDQLQTATTLGLDHVGLPISSDPIASLFGLAKQHGVGEIKDAGRMALRLPAFGGVPTREEARQVLDVSVAERKAITAQCPSLTQQRRKVVPNPGALESLGTDQVAIHVELIPSPKNRLNDQEIIDLSNSYKEAYAPEIQRQDAHRLPESAVS
jgi:hypothetical protein